MLDLPFFSRVLEFLVSIEIRHIVQSWEFWGVCLSKLHIMLDLLTKWCFLGVLILHVMPNFQSRKKWAK